MIHRSPERIKKGESVHEKYADVVVSGHCSSLFGKDALCIPLRVQNQGHLGAIVV